MWKPSHTSTPHIWEVLLGQFWTEVWHQQLSLFSRGQMHGWDSVGRLGATQRDHSGFLGSWHNVWKVSDQLQGSLLLRPTEFSPRFPKEEPEGGSRNSTLRRSFGDDGSSLYLSWHMVSKHLQCGQRHCRIELCYLLLINSNLNTPVWLVVTVLDSAVVKHGAWSPGQGLSSGPGLQAVLMRKCLRRRKRKIKRWRRIKRLFIL